MLLEPRHRRMVLLQVGPDSTGPDATDATAGSSDAAALIVARTPDASLARLRCLQRRRMPWQRDRYE